MTKEERLKKIAELARSGMLDMLIPPGCCVNYWLCGKTSQTERSLCRSCATALRTASMKLFKNVEPG